MPSPVLRSLLQAWLWRMEGQDLFFERGLPLRFKVQSVRFHPVPTQAEQAAQVGGASGRCGPRPRRMPAVRRGRGRGASRGAGSPPQLAAFTPAPAAAAAASQAEAEEAVVGTSARPHVPMEVVGRADGDGLGMVHWYASGEDEGGE